MIRPGATMDDKGKICTFYHFDNSSIIQLLVVLDLFMYKCRKVLLNSQNRPDFIDQMDVKYDQQKTIMGHVKKHYIDAVLFAVYLIF